MCGGGQKADTALGKQAEVWKSGTTDARRNSAKSANRTARTFGTFVNAALARILRKACERGRLYLLSLRRDLALLAFVCFVYCKAD